MQCTITSLNLQGFEDWDIRVPQIIDYLEKIHPDVACFQEAVFLPTVSPFTSAQLLNQQLHYPYEVSDISRLQKGIEYEVYREGLASLSRHQIIKSDTVILKQATGDQHNRLVQLLDLQLNNGQIVKIANVHFSMTDFYDFATEHLQETLEILDARNEKRIIIGDFNLSFLEDSADLWSNDYNSTCDVPYVTYPKMNKRIDYALVPKEYSIGSVSVSGDTLSDHRALTVRITVPDSPLI